MQMYPGWSARDNYAIHKKRRKKKVKQVNEPVEDDGEEGLVDLGRWVWSCCPIKYKSSVWDWWMWVGLVFADQSNTSLVSGIRGQSVLLKENERLCQWS